AGQGHRRRAEVARRRWRCQRPPGQGVRHRAVRLRPRESGGGAERCRRQAACQYRDRKLPGRASLMRPAGGFVVGLVWASLGAILWTAASADEAACRVIGVLGSSLLQQCGDQLHSFGIDLSDMRREVANDQEGKFSYDCPVSLMCIGSPSIGGFFVDAGKWKKSAKDAQAIGQIVQSPPITAESAGAVS